MPRNRSLMGTALGWNWIIETDDRCMKQKIEKDILNQQTMQKYIRKQLRRTFKLYERNEKELEYEGKICKHHKVTCKNIG